MITQQDIDNILTKDQVIEWLNEFEEDDIEPFDMSSLLNCVLARYLFVKLVRQYSSYFVMVNEYTIKIATYFYNTPKWAQQFQTYCLENDLHYLSSIDIINILQDKEFEKF